jgi:uncharacterized protein (DUF2461 family)
MPPTFPPGGAAWFDALEDNMSKAWYDDHKADYQRLWHAPMRQVLEAVAAELQADYDAPLAAPKVHRIHNDRRFRDGPPYKTHCAGFIGVDVPLAPRIDAAVAAAHGVTHVLLPAARLMSAPVALHLSYGAEQHVGAGIPTFGDAATLAAWREAVLDPAAGGELEALLADARGHGLEVVSFASLKQGPAGLRDHPRVDLLKRKGLLLTASPPPAQAADLVPRLITLARQMAPTVRWLARHVLGAA